MKLDYSMHSKTNINTHNTITLTHVTMNRYNRTKDAGNQDSNSPYILTSENLIACGFQFSTNDSGK